MFGVGAQAFMEFRFSCEASSKADIVSLPKQEWKHLISYLAAAALGCGMIG
jgi:hypothetical protein